MDTWGTTVRLYGQWCCVIELVSTLLVRRRPPHQGSPAKTLHLRLAAQNANAVALAHQLPDALGRQGPPPRRPHAPRPHNGTPPVPPQNGRDAVHRTRRWPRLSPPLHRLTRQPCSARSQPVRRCHNGRSPGDEQPPPHRPSPTLVRRHHGGPRPTTTTLGVAEDMDERHV